MSYYDINCPTAICNSLVWYSAFREALDQPCGHYFNVNFSERVATVTLTIAIERRKGKIVEESLTKCRTGLEGLSIEIDHLCHDDVEQVLESLQINGHYDGTITTGVSIQTTPCLVKVILTKDAYKQVEQARSQINEHYIRAVNRVKVLALIKTIADGSAQTASGTHLSSQANAALDFLLENVSDLRYAKGLPISEEAA